MRHKRKGRRLGRTSSHRKALMRNLACALLLTEREPEYFDDLMQADGKTPVNPPKYRGRIVTTIHKAKEVRPMVEKVITIARNALPHMDAASEFATDADRNTEAWKKWRESDQWQKWNQTMAPAIAARRRVFSMLRDKTAVEILFDEVAPRFSERAGGYTRILRLAQPRLGDAGTRAILEFVGVHDRVKTKSEKPQFESDDDSAKEEVAEETKAAAEAPTEEAPVSPKGLGFDDLKVVEGIGPKCEEALKAAGIDTWKALADSTPEKITEILTEAEGNFGGQVPTTWPEQAAMAVAGDWDKLEAWQDELDGGKPAEEA